MGVPSSGSLNLDEDLNNDESRRHEQSARQFLHRYGLTVPRIRKTTVRLGKLLEESPIAPGEREQHAWQLLLEARKTLVTCEEAMQRAEALKLEFACDTTMFARRLSVHCDEILIAAREPLVGDPFERLLARNHAIAKAWAAQRNRTGLISALLNGAALHRLRGELLLIRAQQDFGEDDFKKAFDLSLGVEHLIHAYGKRSFRALVPLFLSEMYFSRVRGALDSRQPEAAKNGIDALWGLVNEGNEWIRTELLRHNAEYLIYRSHKSIAHLQEAEAQLDEAEEIYEKNPTQSPYWRLGTWYRRLELLLVKGRWSSELAEQYMQVCRDLPHLYQYERFRHLCGQRFPIRKAIQPAYVSAGIASMYLDDRLVNL
jgi:hypothetical protein